MKILLVEDEKNLAENLKEGLEENSFVVELAFDGEEGLYLAETYKYNAVVLDIMLPGIDGITILETLRKKKINMPVLLLTARGGLEDRIKGLNLGADDYISKPFEFTELLARLKAVIRRYKGAGSSTIAIGDLVIDANTHSVKRAGKVIDVSSREFSIINYLALNKGRVISSSELVEHIFGPDLETNIVKVYISHIRNKIDRGFRKKLIHTVRGAGYMLKEP
ncbi:MAG TPA: DNA-binding response regulator [Nitrospiraceae bacterium]|nr:DNA-binding response regulator [Nitrospiraceae bacterium]